MMRVCLPSTLRLMPVIQELTSLDSRPSPSALTWSVQDFTPSGVGLDARQAVVARVAEQVGHPVDAVFDAARDVAERGVRAHQHQHVGEALDQDAEIGLRAALPLVLQPHAVDAPDVDAVEGAGDRVEAGGIDDDVELVVRVAGLDAARA